MPFPWILRCTQDEKQSFLNMKPALSVRSVILSDIHLGTPHS